MLIDQKHEIGYFDCKQAILTTVFLKRQVKVFIVKKVCGMSKTYFYNMNTIEPLYYYLVNI